MSVDEFVHTDIKRRWTGYILFRSLPLLLIFSLTAGIVQTQCPSPYPWLIIPLATAWLMSSIGQFRVTFRRGIATSHRVVSGLVLVGTLGILVAVIMAAIWMDFSWLVPRPEGLVDNLWAALFAAVLVILYLNITSVSRPESTSNSALQEHRFPYMGDSFSESRNDHVLHSVYPHRTTATNKMVQKRAHRIERKFGKTIRETAAAYDLDPEIMSAILIFEDMNRPAVVRRLENVIISCLPISMTVGVAQVWSSRPLSDRDSIEEMGRILSDLRDESDERGYTGEGYYWFLLERYNHSHEYARNVFSIFEQIRS